MISPAVSYSVPSMALFMSEFLTTLTVVPSGRDRRKFFIEEDIGGSVKAFNTFVKEAGLQESHSILGGNIEGINYDTAGVVAISKLPSKKELIATIAGRIQAVPTKVARVIKAPGMKVARAIKLAGEEADN